MFSLLSNTELAGLGNVRKELDQWTEILRPIFVEIEAGAGKVATLETHAARTGIPFPTLRAKYYAARKGGQKALINNAKAPLDRGSRLPRLFVQWIMTSHELHQRGQTGREVYRKIIKQWKAWRAGDGSKAIPGYDTPPEPTLFTGVPEGWSQGNLLRKKFKPTKYELMLRRRGTQAARELLPSVPRTRVGLEFGQLFQIDDQDYDTWINLENDKIAKRAYRPCGFNVWEGLSASFFDFCIKPVIFDPATETRARLTEQDCLWFVIHFLTRHGYRADVGTTIFAELGTAAIKEALAGKLYKVSGGKIEVRSGGLTGEPLLRDMGFPVTSNAKGTVMRAGRPKGNFKFKADIEGLFALLRTIMAHLPGPTGTRLTAPEEDYALQIYNSNLLKRAATMPPKRAALLMMEIMPWHDFAEMAAWLYHEMNNRDWHQIEGWKECGFMEQIVRPDPVRLPDTFLTLDQIRQIPDDIARQNMLALAKTPGFGGVRSLTPHEVFTSHAHLLTRLNRHHWNLCIPEEYAEIVRVQQNHEIHVKSRAPGGGYLTYLARAVDARGLSYNLPAGMTVRVYANPFCPEEALACDENDSAIGLILQFLPTMKLDREGALRNHGKIEQMRAEMDAEVRMRAAATVGAQRAYMIAHNKRVIDGEPITDEEHESVERFEEANEACEEAEILEARTIEPVTQEKELPDPGF
jgi:hypothetical protein